MVRGSWELVSGLLRLINKIALKGEGKQEKNACMIESTVL